MEFLKKQFYLDLRFLAIFRIWTGIIILLDLLDRARDLSAHYTDYGILPRKVLLDLAWDPYYWSLHVASGSGFFQLLLFGLATVFITSFILGFKTRWTNFFSWVLLVSLQNRIPLVLHGGDVVMRLMLFWGMFLPLAEYYSFDSLARKEFPQKKFFGVSSFALIAQMSMIYVFSAILKSGAEWKDGSAVYYALSLESFTRPLGQWLGKQSLITSALTYFTWYLEKFGPLLLLAPIFTWQARTLCCLLFISLHLGFFATMHLSFFPWICMGAWIGILPSEIWVYAEKLLKKINNYSQGKIERVFLHSARVANSYCPSISFAATTKVSFDGFRNTVAAFFLLLVFIWNIDGIDKSFQIPKVFHNVVDFFRIDQKWNMFAPYPLKDDGWYVIDAHLKNGKNFDLLTESSPPNWNKPVDVASSFGPTSRWRKVLGNIWLKSFHDYRLYYARYLCRSWNRDHSGDEQLDHFGIYFMLEQTPIPGKEPSVRKVSVWNHGCFL